MAISDPGRGLVRRLGVTAAALLAFSAASQQRAEALSLASPGTALSAKFATDGLTTEVQHRGHGGGGFRGGGGGGFRGAAVVSAAAGFNGGVFNGGGFRGGGAAFHGGGFRGGGVAIHRAVFAPRPCSTAAAATALRISSRYHRPHFHHRHHFHRRSLRTGLLQLPVLPWLSAPLLPRVWTYYGPRKIWKYCPWWRHRYYGYRYW